MRSENARVIDLLGPGLHERVIAEGAKLSLRFPRWLRKVTLPGVVGITIGSRIYVDARRLDPSAVREVVRHELVHLRQLRRTGFVRFYLGYLGSYLEGRLSGKSHWQAYSEIPWEQEAEELGRPGVVDFWDREES